MLLLELLELCASAGFAGVVAWDISCSCGVLELLSSAFGVVLVLGVVLLSGVVVVVLDELLVVVLLAPLAGLAHGASDD